MKAALATVVLLLVIIGVSMWPTAVPVDEKVGAQIVVKDYPAYTDDSMTAENSMALINEQRAANNALPLEVDDRLSKSACAKLDNMVEEQYWSHDSPSGVTPWHWLGVAGYDYAYAGENLAYGQKTADKLIDRWMESPTHRENILDKGFTEQGICIKNVIFLGEMTSLSVSHLASPK